MARYKLQNIMRHTDAKEFKTDKSAWNTLRKQCLFKEEDGTYSGCFIWMWKEVEVEIDVNNEESYVEKYNRNYGPRPYGYGVEGSKLLVVGEPRIETVWVPVLAGITSDPYNVTKKNRKKVINI